MLFNPTFLYSLNKTRVDRHSTVLLLTIKVKQTTGYTFKYDLDS